ncbi:MAG: carboxypeptidase-like regulatory domain-containing protein [Pyrinomonadaceae bacterium]
MTRSSMFSKILLIFCAVLFGATVDCAQEATIAGIIVDSNGARIPSATIHVVSRNGARDFASDEEGFFKGNLFSGRYTVIAQKLGFANRTYKVFLRSNAVSALNVVLYLPDPKKIQTNFKCPKGQTCIIL